MPEDEKRKRFNPFLLLFGGELGEAEKRNVQDALISCLSDMEVAFDLMHDGTDPDRGEVLKNILYLGMSATIRQVLYGKTDCNKEEPHE